MTFYELGQPEKALEQLRALALACDGATPACSNSEVAAIYACVGIVLSGGMKDHSGGVVAFKKALTLQPGTTLAPEYAIPQVLAAFNEASGGSSVAVGADESATSSVQSDEDDEDEEDEDDEDDEDDEEPPRQYDGKRSRLLLLISAGPKVGPYFVSYQSFDYGYDDDFGAEVQSGAAAMVQAGGAFTFAALPFDSAFTLGVRARGGVLIQASDFGSDVLERYAGSRDRLLGYLGAQALLGATLGSRVDSKFSYIYGGAGFEANPEGGPAWFTAHIMGGTSLGGFVLGGGIDFGVRPFENYLVNYFMFGIEAGFGAGL